MTQYPKDTDLFPIKPTLSQAKFSPGKLVSTPGAMEIMTAHKCSPLDFLARHLTGDWGIVAPESSKLNNEALKYGHRLHSIYQIAPQKTIWLITEANRSATTFLLPCEY